MNRVHIALPVARLDDAVRFFSALLGQEPVRRFGEYAQFLLDDPALNLALTAVDREELFRGGHYGVEVPAIEDVDVALARARAAGLGVEVEADTLCCHSRQTKFWVTDPDGRRWEVFHVAERESSAPGGSSGDAAPIACCPA